MKSSELGIRNPNLINLFSHHACHHFFKEPMEKNRNNLSESNQSNFFLTHTIYKGKESKVNKEMLVYH